MKSKFTFLIIIFCACFILGFLVASKNGILGAKPEALSKSLLNFPPAQSNNLIILVDDLTSEKPQLTTIWMVFFYPKSQPYLVLLPVYPTPNKKTNAALQAEFSVLPLSGVTQAFWDKLKADYHLDWDHYLMVDETSLAQLTQKLIGSDPPARLLKPSNKRKISQTLADSSSIVSKICANLAVDKVNPDMQIDWRIFSDHFLSDLSFSALEKNWKWILRNPLIDPCNIISYK